MVVLPPDALEALLLQHPQELRLQGERQLAHLVEKHGARSGELELAELAARGAGIGALLVPEELVLQELVRDGGAVDADERSVTPGAQVMEGASEELFSRAALAEQQHRRVRGGGPLKRPAHLEQRRVLPDDLRKAVACGVLLLENEVLHQQPALLDGSAHEDDEVIGLDGLRQEIEGPLFHRVDGVLDRPVGRHHDDGHVRIRVAGGAQDVAAAPSSGKPQVGENDGDPRLPEEPPRLARGLRLEHAVALRDEGAAEHRAERVAVLDDEHVRHVGADRGLDFGSCCCHPLRFPRRS